MWIQVLVTGYTGYHSYTEVLSNVTVFVTSKNCYTWWLQTESHIQTGRPSARHSNSPAETEKGYKGSDITTWTKKHDELQLLGQQST
jgi:hypothetical protein